VIERGVGLTKKIIIVGVGGMGREAAEIVLASQQLASRSWSLVGFVADETPSEYSFDDFQAPVLGNIDWLLENRDKSFASHFIVAFANGKRRLEVETSLESKVLTLATLIHPSAVIGKNVIIEKGCLIGPGAIITTNVRLAQSVQVNSGVIISHDVTIAEGVTISPGVCLTGNVKVEKYSTVHTNGTVIPGIRIGEGSIIGAGSTVIKDVGKDVTVVGVPSRPLIASSAKNLPTSGLRKNVLITGSCGVTSRSILRSLKLDQNLSKEINMIGMDSGSNVFGIFEGLCDKFIRVPESDSNDYETKIKEVILEEKIAGALVVPENEVINWSKLHDFRKIALIPNSKLAETCASKDKMYENLKDMPYIPTNQICTREELKMKPEKFLSGITKWIRPHNLGSSSGIAARRIDDPESLLAHLKDHSRVDSWQLVDFLSGQNLCCSLIFKDDQFVAGAQYRRDSYFMPHLTPSGITGNSVKTQLVYSDKVASLCEVALRQMSKNLGTSLEGFFSIDLLVPDGNRTSSIFITEINIRPTACVEIYGHAGFNLAATWLRLCLNMDPILSGWAKDSKGILLRDIDGLPIFVGETDARYSQLAVE
jgi:sugar O-acyltransferase (sialic acid O-acetyltransferase NeuD family)